MLWFPSYFPKKFELDEEDYATPFRDVLSTPRDHHANVLLSKTVMPDRRKYGVESIKHEADISFRDVGCTE